jgi:glutamine synthetase
MAAALAGGLYGIERGLEPPPPIRGNAYAFSDVSLVPTSLHDAIPLFEQGEVAREYLGDEFVRFYAATRRFELEQFRRNPTDWEVKRYMEYL